MFLKFKNSIQNVYKDIVVSKVTSFSYKILFVAFILPPVIQIQNTW